MICGVVNAQHEALVRLKMRGPGGIESDVDFIVDSGFTASLTLPRGVVTALGLPRHSGSNAVLADGIVRQFDVFAAEVEWDGTWRRVFVSVIDAESELSLT